MSAVPTTAVTPAPRVATTAEPVLRLIEVSKHFGPVKAVDRVSIDIMDGEVLTLLGPSGCGKTTTLRMVIGLERCTAGEIIYQGQVVDSARTRVHVPTHKRNMGMVFQSYAIWPHMTVAENVAYPLNVRGIRGDRARAEVRRVLDLVGLSGLEQRPATMLSGGQQQRVALARSLVFEPRILLLDEPFSNLDAKLREQMRAELRVLQRRLGITVLFVTHDQIEALSLSDRIAVMDRGRVEQIGSPHELYLQPQTPVVRDFLGKTIILRGTVLEIGANSQVLVDVHGSQVACATTQAELAAGQECFVAIRPEQVQVESMWSGHAPSSSPNRLVGEVEALLFIGERYEARIALPWGESILVYLPPIEGWREGQSVAIHLPPDQVRVWPA